MNLEGVIAALEKLPVVAGLVWRGAQTMAVAPLALAGPLPVSRSVRVATENFRTPLVYAIQVVAAHDVGSFGAHLDSQEVAILPPSTIVPAGAPYDAGGLRVQPFIEIRQGFPTPSTPTVEQIEDAVNAARELPPVEIWQPGRFVDA